MASSRLCHFSFRVAGCRSKRALFSTHHRFRSIGNISRRWINHCASCAEDYLSNNVLPVQILIRNDGGDELLFRIANVRLVWVDGSLRNVLTTPETFAAIKTSVGGAQ